MNLWFMPCVEKVYPLDFRKQFNIAYSILSYYYIFQLFYVIYFCCFPCLGRNTSHTSPAVPHKVLFPPSLISLSFPVPWVGQRAEGWGWAKEIWWGELFYWFPSISYLKLHPYYHTDFWIYYSVYNLDSLEIKIKLSSLSYVSLRQRSNSLNHL